MPPKGKHSRLDLLNKQTATSAGDIRNVLISARDRIEVAILKAANESNFVKSAVLRDTLYAELGSLYVGLQGNVDDWVRKSSTRAARQWRQFAIDDLPRGAVGQTWNQFSRKYLADMIERVHPTAASRIAGVNAQIGGMLQADINAVRSAAIETQRLSAAAGLTAKETRKEMLARTLAQRPGWKFIDAAGRQWEPKNYFAMLNRTMAANVARSSYLDTAAEAGYDLMTIEGGITPWCCDACDKWAGRLVSATGATKGYPTIAEAQAAGLFHPRCRHYFAVVLPGEIPEAKAEEKRLRIKSKATEDERREATRERDNKTAAKSRKKKKREKEAIEKADREAARAAEKDGSGKLKDIPTGTGAPPQRRATPAPRQQIATPAAAKLTRAQQFAVDDYTADPAFTLNNDLRQGKKLNPTKRRLVKDLDGALEKMPDYRGATYRKVSFFDDPAARARFVSEFKEGKEVSFKQYLSTSRNKFRTEFTARNDIAMEIQGKAGKAIENFSKHKTEQEVLFGRNSRFEVVSVSETDTGSTLVKLKEV